MSMMLNQRIPVYITTCNIYNSKKSIKNIKQELTKKKLYNEIKYALKLSKENGNEKRIFKQWEYIDKLTLQYYDENINSIDDIVWLYDITKDL